MPMPSSMPPPAPMSTIRAASPFATLVVSSIYDWFKADFGGSDVGVLRHIHAYAEPALAAKIKSIGAISNHDYDWRLNDIGSGS